MNVVIVAPCHVPLMIGGSEKLWWGLLDHLNRRTEHHADCIKLPCPEDDFWGVVDSYRRFSELDLRPYETIISGKYPAWMADHPMHVCYYQHPLRGLYDAYPAGIAPRCDLHHPEVRALVGLLRGKDRSRAALRECFERVQRLRAPGASRRLRRPVPRDAFAFPGPLIREIVKFCDQVAFRPGAIRRLCAISTAITRRDEYFAPGADPVVVHHPSDLSGFLEPSEGSYLFTVSRLEPVKRIDMLIEAMRLIDGDTELMIAGTGPDDARLRALAGAQSRIRLLGFVNDARLLELYAGALAVLFVPWQEDLGLVALEAMKAGKPVITTNDAGGTGELIDDGLTGYVTEPDPEAIARHIERLIARPELAREMGAEAAKRAREVSWERVCATLLDGLAG